MACSWLQKILLSLLLTAVVVQSLRRRGGSSSSYNLCDCPGRSDFDKVCRCVYLTRCNKTGYVMTGTTGIIVPRAGGRTIECKGAEKCCIVPDSKETSETTTSTSTEIPTTTSTETPTTTSTEIPTTTSTESTTSTTLRATKGTTVKLPTTNKRGCGVRRSGKKNSDDFSTSFAEFPWIVDILISKPNDVREHICAGSLISHNAVLTAAHCVHSHHRTVLYVRAGEWDRSSTAEALPFYDKSVKKIILHKDFDKTSLVNDIALLIVHPFRHQPHIDTICLPEQELTFHGQRCTVAGWGERNKEIGSNLKLSKIDVPVLEDEECRDLLSKTRFGRYFLLDKSFVCAGGEGVGTCKGDGGGPLMCESQSDSGRYYLAGIVAGGLGCGEKDIPDLYADVGQYRDWINTKLTGNGIKSEAVHP